MVRLQNGGYPRRHRHAESTEPGDGDDAVIGLSATNKWTEGRDLGTAPVAVQQDTVNDVHIVIEHDHDWALNGPLKGLKTLILSEELSVYLK